MKKFLLSAAFIALFFAMGAFAQEKTDLEKMNLRGAVKRLETYYLVKPTDGGDEIAKKQISNAILFNRRGQTTETLSYSSAGDPPIKTVYIYNKNGHRILYEYYGGFYRNELTNTWESSDEFAYKYDKAGRILEQLETYKPINRLKRRILLRYDDRGNVIEESHFDLGDDVPSERKAYTFDSQGRQTSVAKFDRHGTMISKTSHTFNNEGQISETTNEGRDWGGKVITTYSYDDKNRIILKTGKSYFARNQPVGRTEYIFDDQQSTREERAYSGDVLFTKIVYKLDRHGNVLTKAETLAGEAKKMLAEVAIQPSNGLIPLEVGAIAALSGMFAREAFSYEYDTHGNWIKRVEYQPTEFVIGSDNLDAELKPVRTQVRTIMYYDQ